MSSLAGLMSSPVFKTLSNFAQYVRVAPALAQIEAEAVGDQRDSVRLSLPYEQLSVFGRRYESSEPLSGLPLYAIAELGRLDLAPTAPMDDGMPPPPPPPRIHVPLGLLGTDHAGYASFDLGVLRTPEVVAALYREKVVEPGDPAEVGLAHLWVLPFADALLIVDALRNGDIGPHVIALRLEFDERRLDGRLLDRPMASMQNPNILDWRMSPGSFTLAGALLVGEDGCETLLPSNLSTQQFRFRQVARVAGRILESRTEIASNQGSDHRRQGTIERYRLGHVFDYTTEWFAIGHSLGALSYSLPLAPGEVVKLAIVDWSRSDAGSRTEDTGFSESLVHDQLRDRTLTESVHAVLDEWQRGGTIMGGVAASGGYGGGGMGVGAAGSLGGAYTTSSGTRDLTADTSQHVADAFHQASSAMRELRSTVVVQNEQAETSHVQTRIVANYNHGHALTMLYYEVLRHYRVVTRLASVRLAVLLDYAGRKTNFRDEGLLLAYRREIEDVLLDERLRACFDSLATVQQGRAAFEEAKAKPKAPEPGDAYIDHLAVTFTTGSGGSGGTDGAPFVDLAYTDGGTSNTWQIEPNDESDARRLGHPGYNDFEQGDVGTYGLHPQSPFQWKMLRGFVVGLDGGGDWRLDHIKLEGFTAAGDRILLFDADYGQDLPNDTTTTEFGTLKPPPGPPPPAIDTFVSQVDLQKVDLLMRHLEAHRYHYDRALWLDENANSRASSFEALTLGGQPLLDLIENRAVELSGDWMAFPVAAGSNTQVARAFEWRDEDPATPADAFVEQLLTLPTRGVFAEAKLGHCNANEVIDDTRFWDWQKSPIPYQAPDITGADAGSRYQAPTGLTPTPFPQSLVNIVNPPTLPDPTGLSDALEVLGTPNVFRDMSAAQEVGTLLGKLSDNATSLASQGMKSSGRQDLLKDIREAPELSSTQKSKLVGDLLTKDVGATAAPTTGSGTGTGASGSGTGTGSGSGTGSGTSTGATTPTTSTGGGTTTPPVPTPTPVTPPKPVSKGPGKPKLPDPAPAMKGLGFQLNFQRVKVATTATGRATVVVRPFGGGIGHDPEAYVPGVTTGPPTAAQTAAMPESWVSVRFDDGGLMLRSDHADGPGQITITAVYDLTVVSTPDVIAGVFVSDTAAHALDAKAQTFTMTNSTSYKKPVAGDIVTLKVLPHVETTVITAEDSSDLETQLAAKVGGSAVLTAEVSAADTTKTGTKHSRSVTLSYLTGGLDITQDA